MLRSRPVSLLLWIWLASLVCGDQVSSQPLTTVRDWNQERVSFWIRVYTLYDSSQTIIHDSVYPHIIYEVLQFSNDGASDIDKRTEIVEQTAEKYRRILKGFVGGKVLYHELTPDMWRVFNLFKPVAEAQKFRRALSQSRIRLQDGRRDLFLAGLVRSGAYVDEILAVINICGLPQQLIALVFVESLFYPKAVSKVGAKGLWQLMPATARQYIKVRNDVDERLDPIISTLAACLIIKKNHEKLDGSWPLALTAYNHGLSGMLRAKRRHGTENLEAIIRDYRSGSFKFASKNFYAQYLAAVEAYFNSAKYFGDTKKEPALQYGRVRIPHPILYKDLITALGVRATLLETMNPSLTQPVLASKLPVPTGYPLRVPVGVASKAVTLLRDEKVAKPAPRHFGRGRVYRPTPVPIFDGPRFVPSS